ncbi:8630_t:CDS:2, partial [Gigaspora rosea]
ARAFAKVFNLNTISYTSLSIPISDISYTLSDYLTNVLLPASIDNPFLSALKTALCSNNPNNNFSNFPYIDFSDSTDNFWKKNSKIDIGIEFVPKNHSLSLFIFVYWNKDASITLAKQVGVKL